MLPSPLFTSTFIKSVSFFHLLNWLIYTFNTFNGGCFNLVLCYVMLPHFMCKIWCSKWAKSYALLCCVMICYADLFYEQNPMLSMSKILWSVMLPLLRDYDWNICDQTLCTVMNSYLMSKILSDLMKLTISYCNQE